MTAAAAGAASAAALQAELERLMTTFRPAPGTTTLETLQNCDALINSGGPAARVRRRERIGDVDGWRLTADIYTPPRGHGWPAVLFLHGGAWVMGNPRSHDRLARELTRGGFLVASLDYPRAPKYPFPAALDASAQGLRWLADHAKIYGGDPAAVAVAGDSAGANLAAALLAAPGDDAPAVRAAALMYGIYDYPSAIPVLAGLAGRDGEHGPDPYLRHDEVNAATDPRLSPAVAAGKFPPTWMTAGGADPLAAQSDVLDRALAIAGIGHEYVRVPDAPHAFLQMPFRPDCETTLTSLRAFLTAHLRARPLAH